MLHQLINKQKLMNKTGKKNLFGVPVSFSVSERPDEKIIAIKN